jgi:hypothetical protein
MGFLLKEDADIANGFCAYFLEVGSGISRQIIVVLVQLK